MSTNLFIHMCDCRDLEKSKMCFFSIFVASCIFKESCEMKIGLLQSLKNCNLKKFDADWCAKRLSVSQPISVHHSYFSASRFHF